jgi:hypothetical protein
VLALLNLAVAAVDGVEMKVRGTFLILQLLAVNLIVT